MGADAEMNGRNPTGSSDKVKADAWRNRLGLSGTTSRGGLEDLRSGPATGPSEAPAPEDRIRIAREEMRRLVIERFGGDGALLAAVDELVLSASDAVAILADRQTPPAPNFDALEAIVAFDGTRPSFLVKEDRIDFDSTFSTPGWRTRLGPHEEALSAFSACVGRVELGEAHVGTAFLVSPTLALTNRHVAQGIADFDGTAPRLTGNAFLDFGREHGGRATHDRREIRQIVLAGAEPVVPPIDHARFDAALIELSPSRLAGEAAARHLSIADRAGDIDPGALVAAVGYPAAWEDFVPGELRTAHAELLARLLAGDGGSKRLSPGETDGMHQGTPRWTVTHDATTLNGNSGSPMAILGSGPLEVTGLHYGGKWRGERTNWAHVLANCGNAACIPGSGSFAERLGDLGIRA